jgi:hypothetical protein
MRRLILAAAGALVLVGAGIAVAHDGNGKSIKQVSATFTATTPSNVRTSTCTAADGTYATSRGDYTGTAVSTDPTLNGNASVSAESVINTTTGFGTVDGRIRIDTADGKHTVAQFDAVYSKDGHISGLAEGHGSEHSWNRLVANLSANYTAAGGFANGLLGGTTGGDAVEVSSGGCKPASSSKPDTIEVHGVITAVSATSITAAGVTCTVPSTISTSALHVGDRVELKCTVSGTTNTASKIDADHHH